MRGTGCSRFPAPSLVRRYSTHVSLRLLLAWFRRACGLLSCCHSPVLAWLVSGYSSRVSPRRLLGDFFLRSGGRWTLKVCGPSFQATLYPCSNNITLRRESTTNDRVPEFTMLSARISEQQCCMQMLQATSSRHIAEWISQCEYDEFGTLELPQTLLIDRWRTLLSGKRDRSPSGLTSSTEWWTCHLCDRDCYPQCKLHRKPRRFHRSDLLTRLTCPLLCDARCPWSRQRRTL